MRPNELTVWGNKLSSYQFRITPQKSKNVKIETHARFHRILAKLNHYIQVEATARLYLVKLRKKTYYCEIKVIYRVCAADVTNYQIQNKRATKGFIPHQA